MAQMDIGGTNYMNDTGTVLGAVTPSPTSLDNVAAPPAAASPAPTGDSLITTLNNAYLGMAIGMAGGAVVNAVSSISNYFNQMDLIAIQADMQKKQLEFQERSATNATQGSKDIEVIKQGQIAKAQATNAAVNESKVKRIEAENKLAEVTTAVKQAKQTEKTGKLDTRRLDRFFDPRDTRLHRSYGQPTVRR